MVGLRRGRVLASALGVAALVGCERSKPEVAPSPPVVVTVSQPVEDLVTDYEDFTGRTDAVFSVDVRARVSGYLEKVNFKDGDEVKEGDLLFGIDARPYKAEMDRSEANLAQSEAHLKRIDADYRRAKNLFDRGNISREEYDKNAGDRSEAEAMVGIARASFDYAKLNMTYTRITAPISGLLSRRLVDPGNLVKSDDTILTSIVSLDPIYMYFDIDERTLLEIRKLIREGKVVSRQEAAKTGKEIPVLIGLSNEDGFPHRGVINFTDNRIDAGTGTLRVRAVLENPAPRIFSPGLFCRVRLPIGDAHKSLMIDEMAIRTDQGKKHLYVVNDKNEVVDKTIEVGKLETRMRVITSGLGLGERVIVSGLQRVRPGVVVVPKARDAKDPAPARKTASAPAPAPVSSQTAAPAKAAAPAGRVTAARH